ncbi:DUF3999 family protein [Desulfovibrio litoralis]|uniref:TIGR03503 family protein n=1 Tax=Desulfovibrio litoralis DSM 11393 TaxID=1121455 RepID=A0A1M7T5I0_9BACT|nr:DUF3999 family protein [Desulfovibrio litoralis]SHN65956.1 Protein of unknown function [Desulfovibrio litoralis DSM 11393]
MIKSRLVFFSLFVACFFTGLLLSETAFSQERQYVQRKSSKKTQAVQTQPILTPNEFNANFEIISDKPIEAGTILSFDLDKQVLSAVEREDLADLAVFNAQGQVVPFGVFEPKVTDETSLREYKLKLFPVYNSYDTRQSTDLRLLYELKSDGQLVPRVNLGEPETQQELGGYILVLPADKVALKKLKFFWKGDYTGEISIESSSDLQNWTTLKRNVVLARLSQGDDLLELNELELDSWLNSRYLRITFQGKAFPLDEVLATVSAVYSKEPELHKVAVSPTFFVGPLEENAEREEGNALVFDLGGVFPNSSFNVNFPDYGFFKGVKVYRRSSLDEPWVYVMRTNFYAIKNNGVILKNPSYYTRYKGTFYDPSNLQGSARYWKLVPNLPSEVLPDNTEVEIEYLPQKIYFLAQGSAPYILTAGNKKLEIEPNIGSLVKNLDPNNFPSVSLGKMFNPIKEPQANPMKKEESPIWYTYALWAVLCLIVAGMSYMAFSLLRKMNKPETLQHDETIETDLNNEKIELNDSEINPDKKQD